jgi:beta-lactam-binding protein with PASTA domain
MSGPGRLTATFALGVVAACTLAACGSSPSANDKAAVRSIPTTTSTTTTVPVTTPTAATTTTGGIVVPNVIGLKIAPARDALHASGLPYVGLNVACNRGTLASQSVVASLSVAGKPPTPAVGAVPLSPGATVAPGTRVGITWSGCFGSGSLVPAVVGLTFPAARHALHDAGLTWACYSVGGATTTTSKATTTTTTTTPGSTTTSPPVTTTTHRPPPTVLTQNPPPGGLLRAGSTVALTMHACPQ